VVAVHFSFSNILHSGLSFHEDLTNFFGSGTDWFPKRGGALPQGGIVVAGAVRYLCVVGIY